MGSGRAPLIGGNKSEGGPGGVPVFFVGGGYLLVAIVTSFLTKVAEFMR